MMEPTLLASVQINLSSQALMRVVFDMVETAQMLGFFWNGEPLSSSVRYADICRLIELCNSLDLSSCPPEQSWN